MSLQVLNCALRFTWHPQYKNKHFYDITKCINFCKLCLIIMRKDLLTGKIYVKKQEKGIEMRFSTNFCYGL